MSKDRKERLRRGKEEEVDATGVTSMLLLLRVPGDGEKVSEMRRKVAKQPPKRAKSGRLGTVRRLASALVRFVNEQRSLFG